MRKIKKLIVAVMAMAMMLGMLTVSASAAEYVDGGELYIVGDFTNWSFEKMDGADGVYTAEVELEAGKKYGYKFTLEAAWNAEITDDGNNGGANVYFTPETAGTYVFTVDTSKVVEGADATHWNGGEAITVEAKAAGDAPAGVSTPVVAVAVVAVIALAGAVVCMKKRTVAE